MKILFVDDDPDISEQAKIFLEREDERLDVVTVNDPREGLELLREDGYDAIVSDYQMPEVDGLELLRRVREEDGNDVPFIILTGKGDEEIAMKALNLGADRYFRKGVGNPEDNFALLVRVLDEEIESYREEKREDFLHELLSHDMKNKLQGVTFYYELFQETEPTKEELEDYMEKMGETSEEVRELVEKINTLKTLNQRELRDIRLDEIVQNAIDEIKPFAQNEGIEIETQLCRQKVAGDLILKELFLNLLENSIKHAGCGLIRVGCSADGDWVVVTVEDDGVGIPDDTKEKIFEKDFKSRETGGSGLGLYLVREIAENYGGEIEVKDSELGGARFDVRLQKV